LATPVGVTVEDVGRSSQVYADAKGMTLYTFDKDTVGRSACAADCAAAWPPLMAKGDDVPFGDWSLIVRDGGARQWALRGQPLYTFMKDENPGDKSGDGLAKVWSAAAFAPAAGFDSPPDVDVREVPSAPGQVLVNAAGLNLYVFNGANKNDACVGRCLESWHPVSAPAIANAIGKFTTINRGDGVHQWSYRGNPLYTYSDDVIAGDLHGRTVDDRFSPAVIVRYFTPPEVDIIYREVDPIHPAILTNADRMTLYAREKWAYTQTFHARDGDRHGSSAGRAVGTDGCDAKCLTQWHPLKAPERAEPSGEWTIYTHEDGIRQWAYRGFALYTFSGDKAPGDMRSDESFEPWRGENAKVGLKPVSIVGTASTMYWRVASP
jgi:predicted lipoprotein with Yx(FWY)xxD motif